jgi:cephalosporin-C deacetylase-like acetyl esterase
LEAIWKENGSIVPFFGIIHRPNEQVLVKSLDAIRDYQKQDNEQASILY